MERPWFWLASYPKSGNTWLRLFLANMLTVEGDQVGINAIGIGALDNDRSTFDSVAGLASDELTTEQVDRLRPEVCRALARRATRRLYSKTHDRYLRPDGLCLFPAEITTGAIYVVRNPFDLAISCASFFQTPIDEMIDQMADPDHALSARTDRRQLLLTQQLGSWSDHVMGWAGVTAFPVLVMRYEDMVRDPEASFGQIAAFAGLPADRVSQAITHTRFDQLQKQEMAEGFRENLSAQDLFFRSGRVGDWRDQLSGAQVDRLIADHGQVARNMGYLDGDNRPQKLILGGAAA